LSTESTRPKVAIIGAGFTGLAAAYELVKQGVRVEILESAPEIGGLAGSFSANGVQLEKFYHHWFTSDGYIYELVRELGALDQILPRGTRTGLYYANKAYRLSSPADLLRFSPLGAYDRLRLGALVLRARGLRDWKRLEGLTAAEWLRNLGGSRVYKLVWEPLLRGKFGTYAEEVSAVWFWNKLKLRGGSRRRDGAEQLVYYKGGFAALVERLSENIVGRGGLIRRNAVVNGLLVRQGVVSGVICAEGRIEADAVIATPALPIVADLVEPHCARSYVAALRRIKYLGNVCVVLELDRSLSETYWLNVNDPSFPFVGVIEHTNFEPPSSYQGRHIVYLSKYLTETEALYRMSDQDAFAFTLPHLKRMFPGLCAEWVKALHVWRARYAQPIVERNYGSLIPSHTTPLPGLYVASMAQIYPEDRGTNYAVRDGTRVARMVWSAFRDGSCLARASA